MRVVFTISYDREIAKQFRCMRVVFTISYDREIAKQFRCMTYIDLRGFCDWDAALSSKRPPPDLYVNLYGCTIYSVAIYVTTHSVL